MCEQVEGYLSKKNMARTTVKFPLIKGNAGVVLFQTHNSEIIPPEPAQIDILIFKM